MNTPILKSLKKHDLIPIIENYYKSIDRDKYPNINEYSLKELKACIQLFQIEIKYV